MDPQPLKKHEKHKEFQRFLENLTNHKNRAKSVQSIICCAFRCGLALSGSEKRSALQMHLRHYGNCSVERAGGGQNWRQDVRGSARECAASRGIARDRPQVLSQMARKAPILIQNRPKVSPGALQLSLIHI